MKRKIHDFSIIDPAMDDGMYAVATQKNDGTRQTRAKATPKTTAFLLSR
jgi:hypothetical protein